MYTTAASTKVFDILELATLIADDLNQHDLAQCCCVNKSFFDTFTPHLWHSITFQRFDPTPKFQSPEGQAGLQRNGHHIRVIRTHNLDLLEPFLDYGKTCTNLICLDGERSDSGDADNGRSRAVALSGRRGSIGNGQKQVKGNRLLRPFKEGRPVASRHAKNIKVLLSIIQRNPRLQFLILPVFCFKSESLVKAMAEKLLGLRELYSPSQTWRWGIYKDYSLSSAQPSSSSELNTRTRTATIVAGGKATEPEHVSGSILSMMTFHSTQLLQKYPRLAELERDKFSRINQEAIHHIRATSERLPFLQVYSGDSYGVNLMLNAASRLKGIFLLLEEEEEGMYDIGGISQEAFLKHAPTLECLDIPGYDFDVQIFNAILRSSPNLKSVKAIEGVFEEDNHVLKTEVKLDASKDFFLPWASNLLEVFECLIGGVPRPDMTLVDFDDTGDISNIDILAVQDTDQDPPTAPGQEPSAAQQESYTVQKRVLAQLGRLTHLRRLCLGSHGREVDDAEYSLLAMRGKQTMVIDEYTQTGCLELSLESGLEALEGLKKLEELDVTQLAHRIGVPEVQWMVAHWPKLKAICGLTYWDYNDEFAGIPNIGVLECVTWIRKHRPDIRIT